MKAWIKSLENDNTSMIESMLLYSRLIQMYPALSFSACGDLQIKKKKIQNLTRKKPLSTKIMTLDYDLLDYNQSNLN